jgi:mannan endo-1,4-beta-mannosidase
MLRKIGYIIGISLLALILMVMLFPTQTYFAGNRPQGYEFVKQAGPELRLHGRPFRFAGTNNYYPMYKSQFMVDDVLETAAANGFRVFRMWSSIDIGYNDEDWSHSLHRNDGNVYFHYWDQEAAEPAFNDGADGLEHMDYIIWKARELDLKLVLPLVNNWQDFGGMDQYVRWRELQLGPGIDRTFYHSDFYSDPVIRQWYKDWIAHLLNRVNPLTGLAYKDDPTIMTWELGNEPRCKGSGVYPPSPDCSTETLIEWADDVSHFIKRIDNKHLVSVGDEGFYCIEGAEHWTENCGEGVDTIAFTKLEKIDVMSFHLYPDHWGTSAAWGTEWIERHLRDARRLRKPAMLGEYGWQEKSTRNPVFKAWTDAVFEKRGAGALYWILSGYQDDGTLYPDYDGFTVYCPSPVCTTLGNFADIMAADSPSVFPPVADHEEAVTEFETPVTFTPAANDIAYGEGNAVVPATIDLNPSSAGQQTTVSMPGGTFTLMSDGTVDFVPDAGFSGDVMGNYTIEDSFGQVSNVANLDVTVKPLPGVPIQLFSFETGTEGWGPASWEPTSAIVSQSSAWATDGSYSLFVDAVDGGWIGVQISPPLDLSDGYTVIEVDLNVNPTNGTWFNIAMQVGSEWTWCQGPGGWVPQGTNATMKLDLLSLSCASPELSAIQTLFMYTQADYYIDNIWAR